MSIIRWDPYGDMQGLQNAVNRLFDDSIFRTRERQGNLPGIFPVDVFETADAVVVQAEIAGLNLEDINVQIMENQLYIQGEKKQAVPDSSRLMRSERAYGRFQRSFTIGIPVKQDGIKAGLKNGVLEVVLPKADESKPRQITIDVTD